MEPMEIDENLKSSSNPLLHEFYTWLRQSNSNWTLTSHTNDDDGTTRLKFYIDQKQSFLVICPSNYPNYEDNFFVESSTLLRFWCNSLNEYILDSEKKLFLKDVLEKGLTLLSKETSNTLSSSESDGEEDINDDFLTTEDEVKQDEEWEFKLCRKKKCWRIKEAQIRAANKQPKISDMFEGAVKDHPKQVFSNSAASGILTNDLVAIMESHNNFGIIAEPIDDNIYNWSVLFSKFHPDSNLQKDLNILKQCYGYDYIELELNFTMDLYPFYPPVVKVVRPRLEGSMMLCVASMDMLKLSSWRPVRDMMSVLRDIKDFLEVWARLDLNNIRNDLEKYKQGAYLNIENHLLCLSWVSEVPARANVRFPIQNPKHSIIPTSPLSSSTTLTSPTSTLTTAINEPNFLFKSSKPNSNDSSDKLDSCDGTISKSNTTSTETSGSKECNNISINIKPNTFGTTKLNKTRARLPPFVCKHKKEDRVNQNFFPAGTGYSSHASTDYGWDKKAYLAAKREKDKQIETVLQLILEELRIEIGTKPKPDCRIAEPAGQIYSSFRSNKPTDLCIDTLKDDEQHLQDVYGILEASALIPFMESKLLSDTFLEICQHTSVYCLIIDIISEMTKSSCLVPLLWKLPGQNASIYYLISKLEDRATLILNNLERSQQGSMNGFRQSSSSSSTFTSSSSANCDENMTPSKKSNTHSIADYNQLQLEEKLARDITQVAQQVRSAILHLGYELEDAAAMPLMEHSKESSVGNEKIKVVDETLRRMYIESLKDLQFGVCDFEIIYVHHYVNKLSKSNLPTGLQMMRIAQELGAMASSLPLDLGSSIFIRSDDSKCTLLRALIIGPEGTPYSGGCFIFDIWFPTTYPNTPPKVHFCTTGRGTVTFNPNLYPCGTVCLSLLGTWRYGEQWHCTSTLLQVLVSIQSMVLVPEPFFNEPGFEVYLGTQTGELRSKAYNKEVIKNTIKFAMLEYIQNPPPEFREVIHRHFALKGKNILQEIKEYIDSNNNASLAKLYSSLKTEIKRLQNIYNKEYNENYKQTLTEENSSSCDENIKEKLYEQQNVHNDDEDDNKKKKIYDENNKKKLCEENNKKKICEENKKKICEENNKKKIY